MALLGPPEALRWIRAGALVPASLFSTSEQEPDEMNLIDALVGYRMEKAMKHEGFTRTLPSLLAQPVMGWTQNGSATFKSTGSACLDFFFHVHQLSKKDLVPLRLARAWAEDPLTALKLVMQLRAVRGSGKSDRGGFFAAAMWLYKEHPKTLLANLWLLPQFGCFKDLLVLVRRVVDDDPVGNHDLIPKLKRSRTYKIRDEKHGEREERVKRAQERMEEERKMAAEKRRENRERQAAKVLIRYTEDATFRALHDEVGRVFAQALKEDMLALQGQGEEREQDGRGGDGGSGKEKGRKSPHLSLAAKWAPSLDKSFDRRTLLAESVARSFYKTEGIEASTSAPDGTGVVGEIDEKDRHGSPGGAFALRDKLRKEVLVPLRCALELPEVYMSAGRWGELPYGRVPSVCMKNNRKHFMAHDGPRFVSFLEDVKEGKAKIAAGAVLPHEILRLALEEARETGKVGFGELQWRRLVQDVQDAGTLTNCIAVADVSGSMSGLPMEVAVALSLVIADISSPPWHGHIITFSQEPQIHCVRGETLAERAEFVQSMDWGMNTDFQRVFDEILRRAQKFKVKEEGMVKRVYVFSDMEFDQASASDHWATDHEEIVRKYTEAGYPVPEIVYWNLSRHSTGSTPVCMSEPGAALVSGFSKSILSVLMKGETMTPLQVMQEAIKGRAYDNLKVVD